VEFMEDVPAKLAQAETGERVRNSKTFAREDMRPAQAVKLDRSLASAELGDDDDLDELEERDPRSVVQTPPSTKDRRNLVSWRFVAGEPAANRRGSNTSKPRRLL